MAVRQRGHVGKRKGKRGISWHAIISPPRHPVTRAKRKQKWLGTYLRRRDAVEAVNYALAQQDGEDKALKGGEIVVDTTITVGEWLGEWFEIWKAEKPRSPTTIPSLTSKLNSIKSRLGDILLAELLPKDIRGYIRQCQEEDMGKGGKRISPNTIRKRLTLLNTALNQAIEDEKIKLNPLDKVKWPAPERFRPFPITQQMLDQLLNRVAGTKLLPLCYMDVRSGLRRGEIVALKWSKVDLERRLLTVDESITVAAGAMVYKDTKSEAGKRVVPVGEDLALFLTEHREVQRQQFAELGLTWSGDTYVFYSFNGKKYDHYHPAKISTEFKVIVRELGFDEKVRFHDLRHAFSSFLADANVNIVVQMALMGHSSPRQTVGYTHPSEEAKKAAADSLDGLLGRNSA